MLPRKPIPQFRKPWHYGDPDAAFYDAPQMERADVDDMERVLDSASPRRPYDFDDSE
jgi:hypothetical protein